MTRQQVLEKLDALRSVVEKLPEDADILAARVDEVTQGLVEGNLHLFDADISGFAAKFDGAAVFREEQRSGDLLYFRAAGVKVYQYGKEP